MNLFISYFLLCLYNILENLQCLLLVLYSFSQSESMWKLWMAMVYVLPFFLGTRKDFSRLPGSEVQLCDWTLASGI